MSEQRRPDAEASPLPDAVRTVAIEAFARALLRDLRAAGVLPEVTTASRETDVNPLPDAGGRGLTP
jgi:hypothetical protein